MNDLSAGTNVGSIEIDGGGYSFSGHSIELSGSIHASYSTGLATFAINTQLNGSQTIDVDGGTLDDSGIIGQYDAGSGLTKSGSGLSNSTPPAPILVQPRSASAT